jgi:hypothetical protein
VSAASMKPSAYWRGSGAESPTGEAVRHAKYPLLVAVELLPSACKVEKVSPLEEKRISPARFETIR